ncbi:hypothetical protein ACWGBV_03605 [Streptomyces sp. NPDC055051]
MALDDATRARIREHAERLAAAAPPLTRETRDRLAGLLRDSRRASAAERPPLRLAA